MAEGRTALVTGGARRVGRRIVERLVAGGWNVIVHATDEERALEAARECGAAGAVGADLRDPQAPARVAAAVEGPLDLLVNNAATFVRVGYEQTTLEQWHEAFDVNARAPFFLVLALLPRLEAAGGCVVNISDHAANEHWTDYAAHCAAKAALESLTLSGAKALRPRGVRVCAVSPGTVLPPDDMGAEAVAKLALRKPIGSPDDVADAVMELANDRARTGEVVVL